MATTNTKAPGGFLKKVDQLEAGITKNVVGRSTITVSGTAMTAAQIIARLAQADTLYKAVTDNKSAWKKALGAYEAALPGIRSFVDQLELAIKATFGKASPILADFGLKPAKPAVKSAETKAKAVAQSRRTRQVRGTMGKNQKAQITTQGQPGLVLVEPTGEPVPGALTGPIPPGAAAPVAPNLAVAPSTDGSTPSDGSASGGSAGTGSASGGAAGAGNANGGTPVSGK